MTEAQAIRRLKKGDIGGMEELVALHQAKALRTACLITRDEETAKDAEQNTYISENITTQTLGKCPSWM